jgi:hypothetical protein
LSAIPTVAQRTQREFGWHAPDFLTFHTAASAAMNPIF